MLLRKQTSYNQIFRAKMEFKPTVRGYEAGVVLWWSQYSYASFGIVATLGDNGKLVPKISYKGTTGKAGEFKVIHPQFFCSNSTDVVTDVHYRFGWKSRWHCRPMYSRLPDSVRAFTRVGRKAIGGLCCRDECFDGHASFWGMFCWCHVRNLLVRKESACVGPSRLLGHQY